MHRFRFDKKESSQSNGIPLLDGSSIHRGREGLRLTEGYDAKKLSSQKRLSRFLSTQEVCKSTPRDSTADAAFQRADELCTSVHLGFEQHPRQKKTESIERNRFNLRIPTHRRHEAPFNVRKISGLPQPVSIEFPFSMQCSIKPGRRRTPRQRTRASHDSCICSLCTCSEKQEKTQRKKA